MVLPQQELEISAQRFRGFTQKSVPSPEGLIQVKKWLLGQTLGSWIGNSKLQASVPYSQALDTSAPQAN